MLCQFFDQDRQDGIFNKVVKRKLQASEKYKQHLRDNGLLIRDEQYDLITQALQELDKLSKTANQELAAFKMQPHLAI